MTMILTMPSVPFRKKGHPSVREIRVAPIFDSGNAMFWDRPRLEDVDLADISVSSFRKKAEMLEEFQR